MRNITARGSGPPTDPDAYWRRRFLILGGGLAVLMVLAWLFGGGPSKQASQTAAVRASMAARQARGTLPSAAYGTPSGAQPSPSPASPWDSGSPTVKPSPSVPASAASTSKKPGKGGHCPADSIVVSLFTSKSAYLPGEEPTFNVYAVSTSASACQMKYGPAAVRVLVTRHGKMVWDSAACPATSHGEQMVRLAPGVPQEVALSWNRKASAQSCAGTLPAGAWGTFEVMAQADGHSSVVRSFKILS